MVGILAEREIVVSPLEATVFALGIHEDTGSLGYPGVGVRDAEALAWCLRHGARQEMVAQFLRSPARRRRSARSWTRSSPALETATSSRGSRCCWRRSPGRSYVDGVSNLAHKIVDLTDALALVCLVEMDGRVFCVVRTRLPELDAAVIAAALGGGGHSQAASAVHQRPARRSARARSRRASEAARPAAHRRGDHVAPGALRRAGRQRLRGDGRSASATARAGSSSATSGALPATSRASTSTRRSRTASRTRP